MSDKTGKIRWIDMTVDIAMGIRELSAAAAL